MQRRRPNRLRTAASKRQSISSTAIKRDASSRHIQSKDSNHETQWPPQRRTPSSSPKSANPSSRAPVLSLRLRPARSSSRSQRPCVSPPPSLPPSSWHIRNNAPNSPSPTVLPHDTYARDWGLFIASHLPAILGANIAGTVAALGPDICPSSLNIGDSVFGLSNLSALSPDQGGLQEYAILSASAVAKTPPGFSHEDVATLPVNLVTAWEALFSPEHGLGFPAPVSKEAATPSDTLLILGASASNGRFAIQLAALAGVRTIIAVAGPESKNDLLALGATHVLDRHLPAHELAQQLRSLVGSEEGGVTKVYHAHGMTFDLDVALLPADKESRLISVHPLEGESAERLAVERPLCEASMIEASNAGLAPSTREFWNAVPRWLGEGKVRPGKFRVVQGLDRRGEIEGALDGYREGAADGGNGGVQVVVRM